MAKVYVVCSGDRHGVENPISAHRTLKEAKAADVGVAIFEMDVGSDDSTMVASRSSEVEDWDDLVEGSAIDDEPTVDFESGDSL